MVHAGLARGVARHTVPGARATVSNGTCGADTVAVSVVHIEAVCTIVTNEVLSALEAAGGAAGADRAEGGESVVAVGLADSALKDERTDALTANVS
jgi:hypothetical protein